MTIGPPINTPRPLGGPSTRWCCSRLRQTASSAGFQPRPHGSGQCGNDSRASANAAHQSPSVVSGDLVPGRFHDQHSGEPVPLVISGRNALRDDVTSFSERACALGGLGLVRGTDFMNILLSQTERTNVIGWRAAPGGGLYRPKRVTPFTF